MATPNTLPSAPVTVTDVSEGDPVTKVLQVKRSLLEVVTACAKAGQVFFVGEWRGYKPEEIKFTSKRDGQKQVMKMIRHTLEVGDADLIESVSVSQNLAETFDLAKAKEVVPFIKGARLVVVVSQYIVDKGVRSARASEMHVVTPS